MHDAIKLKKKKIHRKLQCREVNKVKWAVPLACYLCKAHKEVGNTALF